MTTSMRGRAAALGGLAVLALLGLTGAQAQTRQNPNLPRSPYALPEPQYQGQDDDEDDDAPTQGSWRHWGDTRNEGELVKGLFAPNGVAGGGPGPVYAPDAGRDRYCRRHPGACQDD